MIKDTQLKLSEYSNLYDVVVPKDNLLRKLNDLVDFSFIYEELENKYCCNNGRAAIHPIVMFKYLLLKVIYELSDVDVVERSRFDMSFKYFLGLTPEEDVINPSSLTKFRKLRLKDINILDLLISKSVEIALDKGIIKSNSIIVDSTHSKSRYNQLSPRAVLVERSKKLRHKVYQIDEKYKEKMPKKINNGILEDQIEYCQSLISVLEKDEKILSFPAVKQELNLLKEIIEDDLEHLALSKDNDAKVGHKTADTSFFGYKTHIAMTEERLISAATITSGEKHDGKELESLLEKSMKNGINVKNIIGDSAYSEKDNLRIAKSKNIKLISKLSKCITHGNRKNEDKFYFNKDAEMYVCKAGHMAIKKRHQGKLEGKCNSDIIYYFDIEKCKKCQMKDGCYREGAKTKTYSVKILKPEHLEQKDFQETEYFAEKAKERYKIEAKNSELKHRHGYDVASYSGLLGMQIQGATAIFAVNMKRILKLV